MQPEILLCVSQQANEQPYQFKTTGIHVYSFEEALYHVYHYWKQSVDDILSDEMITWVNDTLALSYPAARMKEIARMERFSRRMLAFLRIIAYFDHAELEALRIDLEKWEKRLDWEKLKERADYLVSRNDPEKAVVLYRRALQYDEHTSLLNNLGVALMQMEAYGEAFRYLARACALEPDNTTFMLHYAEAAIYHRQYDAAVKALAAAAAREPQNSDVPFLYGELAFEQGNFAQSITWFQQAIDAGTPKPHYIFRLSDVYVKMRQYDRALAVLSQIPDKNVDVLIKQAALYASGDNVPAAVKSIQKALVLQNTNAELWVKLAMYHRLDYDLSMANAAIGTALSLDAGNERAKLENARIKKGMGRTKEYQAVLNNVLAGFKQKYRELISG